MTKKVRSTKSTLKSKTNEPQSLRVLMVEDSEDDALLIIRELKKGGYNPVQERVETAAAMKKALQEKQWDIILCDYKLPKFNAPSAIALLKEANIDISLIIVSGAIGEETAIECLRLGAHDYIMKNNLSRLCPAIAKELKEAETRSKQKQAEEALREGEEKYRNIIENMQDGYFELDLSGNYTFVNDAECRNIGYSREELIGKNSSVFQDEVNYKKTIQFFAETYKTGKPVNAIEMECIRKDGTKGTYELSLSLIKDAQGKLIGFRSISRDITERKKMEEALRQSEERYRTIIEQMADGYFENDLTGNFTFLNDTMCQIFGYPKEELMGMNNRQHTDQENSKRLFQAFNEVYRTGEPGRLLDYEIIRKDGAKRNVETSFAIIRDTLGKSIGFRGIIRDTTERKQAEEERKQSFERMRKALKATVQAISMTVEMKDPYTSGHQRRVSDLARSIATEMGLLADRRDFIRTASTIHDIGKISIPSEILSKPTKLTDLEFNLIKTHSQSGYDILKDIEFPWPVANVILQHHERMDGSGYPQGLKGDNILLEARIISRG